MPEANTFAGGTLDRAGEHRRDGAWIAERLRDPASRAVLVSPSGVAMTADDPPRAALVPLDEAREAGAAPALLGLAGGRALFAAEVPDGARPVASLRDVAARLPADEAALLAYASALLAWHRHARFCGVCGAETEVHEAGHLRTCPRCGVHHHPRTDPVVIMLVTDGDRAVLGRQPSWPEGRYSALAGFVEPGESLEDAIAREVREEAGVEIADPAYASSQPWPFPASLMLGFHARWAGGEPGARDGELADARWFTRDELAREAGRAVLLPPREAIARRLIDAWLGGATPRP